MPTDDDAHELRAALASAHLREAAGAEPLALSKRTSNLFRDRSPAGRQRVDLAALNQVLGADMEAGWVDVEGVATYEDLVAWCLPRGVMPAVVPQLKTITVGGAVAGVGIEATSFRHGLVHDTMRELEVLLPGGERVTCTPGNEHADLFFGFPNSYGTLGYALRLRLDTAPALPAVHVVHHRFSQAQEFFDALAQACHAEEADFVDGVVFGEQDLVLSTARFVPEAPWLSDYTYRQIYYRSLQSRGEDFLGAAGYLWRWDTDWFWCSRNFGAQNPLLRTLLGRSHLNSRTYTHWMRLNARWQLSQRVARLRRLYRESVVQDVDIPLARAPQFLEFLHRELGVLPVWVCPVRGAVAGRRFPLYPLDRSDLYVNFGFWDVIRTRHAHEPAHFNRRVEQEVMRLGGIKSLYSDSYFTPSEFAAAYGQAAYERLKAKYDPEGRAPHLYDKCVHGA